jgi:hypothetical protein
MPSTKNKILSDDFEAVSTYRLDARHRLFCSSECNSPAIEKLDSPKIMSAFTPVPNLTEGCALTRFIGYFSGQSVMRPSCFRG